MWNQATSCSVTSPSITRSGYTPKGFAESSIGTVTWNVGASRDVNSNKTWYAIWTTNSTNACCYLAGGGSVPSMCMNNPSGYGCGSSTGGGNTGSDSSGGASGCASFCSHLTGGSYSSCMQNCMSGH